MPLDNPTRHDPEITVDDERIIGERIKTYDRDKQDTSDAKESLEQMLRERHQKRVTQAR